MTEAAKAPVMADVARLAGVSHQTVSRVINGSDKIRPDTRERVQRAIDQLGYRPNPLARALVRGRSGLIGIVVATPSFYGPGSIQRSVENAAQTAGYFATSASLLDTTLESLTGAINHLMRAGVEGIVIVAGTDAAVELAHASTIDVPVVIVQGDLSRAALTVGVDQFEGARLATQHLIDLGHTKIAHVCGPAVWAEARARRDGWAVTMSAAGLPAQITADGDWTTASGYRVGKQLCAIEGLTAVFCANDEMAVGLLAALHESGLRAPEDVSIVGFDDTPKAAYLVPSLTTVAQDFEAVGKRAIKVLRRAIKGGAPEPTDLIKPELIVRASTRRLA